MSQLSPRAQKSEYSYLQYHWCPTTFSVRAESMASSDMYNSRREGMATWIKIMAGMIVQMHSTV
jgi:hypothetical protein